MAGNLLNFNPDRPLGFDLDRDLKFNPDRDLGFDPSRDLGFHVNRDLGFGKRAVMFRGYVCAACGALTWESTTRCEECGAVFEEAVRGERGSTLKASHTSMPHPPSERPVSPPPKSRGGASAVPVPPQFPSHSAPKAPAASGSKFCVYCGSRVWQGDEFCWNCGNRSGPVPPRPDAAGR